MAGVDVRSVQRGVRMDASKRTGPPRAANRDGAVQLAFGVALVVLTVAAYARFVSTGFAATDSLPLVETSRIATLADVEVLFTHQVMAGTRFALTEVVYRPFVSLTFGIDYAFWGLDARGYHITNLVIHLVGVLSTWFLLTRLGLRNWSAAAGAAMFALHPLVVASVPVIARRDSIAPVSAFIAGAALLLVAEQSRGARRAWFLLGSVVLIAIALLSKESAFAALLMLPMLVLAAVLARGEQLRAALRLTVLLIPFLVLAVGMFGVRLLVLRGLGGPGETSDLLVVDWNKYSQILGAFTRELAWTFAGIASSTREIWPRLAGLSLAGLALTLPWLPRRHALLATAGALWVVGFAVFCIVLKIATIAWLAYFALLGVALLFAAGLEGALVRLRASGLPGGGAHAGPEPHASLGPEVGLGPEAGLGAEVGLGPQAGLGPEAGVGLQAGLGAQAGLGSQGGLDPQAGVGLQAGLGSQVGLGPQAGLGSEVGLDPQGGLGPAAGLGSEVVLDRQVGLGPAAGLGPRGGLGPRAWLQRAAAAALFVGLVVYGVTALYASPLLHNYDQWQIAGDVTGRFTRALQTCVAQSPTATQVRLTALPSTYEDGRVDTNLMGVTLIEDYTVDSALRLLFPDRPVAVHVTSWETLRAGADTLKFTCQILAPDTVELTTTY